MSNVASKQRLLAILMTVIIGLLCLNAYLFWNKTKQQQIIKEQTTEISEVTKMKEELNRKYYESLAELEEKRSDNGKLNELIDSQKEELKKQKNKISVLLKDSRNLKKAREELNQIRPLTDGYIKKINELELEKSRLSRVNTQLSEEKQILTAEVQKERRDNDQLVTEKTILVNEKTKLETEKESLARKVDIASVIKIRSLDISGYKVSSSGRELKRDKAKNIDRLRICFNTEANQVVPSDLEQFFIRVVNPVGETITVDTEGSGIITHNATNRKIRYTRAAEVDYNNQEQNICTEWDAEIPFTTGTYEIEVFNKGFLSGRSNFEMK